MGEEVGFFGIRFFFIVMVGDVGFVDVSWGV